MANVALLLCHRLWRWPNIKTAMVQCIVLPRQEAETSPWRTHAQPSHATIVCPFLGWTSLSSHKTRVFWRHPYSICPCVFSCKMFGKSDFFVYSDLEYSTDEKKKGLHFFLTLQIYENWLNPKWPPCFQDIIYFIITFEIMNKKTCIIYRFA